MHLLYIKCVSEVSFEMVDDHLIFLVTIPIHDGSNESSEKGSEAIAKSSGTSIQ